MRKIIGIAAIIKNQAGFVLVQDHVKIAAWSIPVGKVEEGEEPLDALKREMFEELNVEIADAVPIIEKDICISYFGEEVEIHQKIYEVVVKDIRTLKNKEPAKHVQLRFMSLEELRRLHVSDATKLYLEYV